MLPACLKHSEVQCGTVCCSWGCGPRGKGDWMGKTHRSCTHRLCRTSLLWTLLGPSCWLSCIERCPYFRGRFVHSSMWFGLQTVSSLERWPLFRVSFIERLHCSLFKCLLQGLPLIILPLDVQYVLLFGEGSICCVTGGTG